MTGVWDSGDQHAGATSSGPDPDTNDLVAHIRELTVDDPRAVHQVVAEVLAALDRATGRARGAVDRQVGDVGPDGRPASTT